MRSRCCCHRGNRPRLAPMGRMGADFRAVQRAQNARRRPDRSHRPVRSVLLGGGDADGRGRRDHGRHGRHGKARFLGCGRDLSGWLTDKSLEMVLPNGLVPLEAFEDLNVTVVQSAVKSRKTPPKGDFLTPPDIPALLVVPPYLGRSLSARHGNPDGFANIWRLCVGRRCGHGNLVVFMSNNLWSRVEKVAKIGRFS